MQQCCTGPCLMFCTWKVMLLIGLLKDYGRFNLLTKTGCVFYVSLSICSTVWLYVSCHIPSQIRGEKHSVTRCCQIISLTNVIAIMYWTCDVKQVGLVLDAGLEEELRIRHLQVADAVRASLGLPVVEYIVTDTPLEVPIFILAVICSKM